MNRRNTKQKAIILDAVKSRCDHPTAEQIYNQVHEVDQKISVGTVYRNLDILSKQKDITNIKLFHADRYDLKTENHNHFICEKCGKVFDINIPYNTKLDNTKHDGFYISSHQTVYKGLCPKCDKSNNKIGGKEK